jgi:regulator of sigma E protease
MNNWYLLAAIPVFGICVLMHEFGHFITAKWAGVRVEEFGIGFPPRLVGFRKRDSGGWEVIWFGGGSGADYGEKDTAWQSPLSGTSGGVTDPKMAKHHTIYSINLLPIGGFVRMPGENGDVNDENGRYDPGSFAAKTAGKRVIILVAGVTMNVILAMVLFTIAYTMGEPTYPPLIGQVVASSPAAHAGLQPGDSIVSVNGKPVQLFTDLQADVTGIISADKSSSPTVPVTMVVRRPDGKRSEEKKEEN